MSIRLRLTLLYTAILALTLASFGGALYGTQSRSMRAGERRMLAELAHRIAHVYPEYREFEAREFLPPPPTDEESPERRWRFGSRTLYLQLLNPEGQVIDHSENLDGLELPLSAAGLQALQSGTSWVETTPVEGERLLVHSEPVIVEGQVTAIVQVARPLTDQEQYLSTLRRNLLLGAGAAVVIAFGAGWLLSGAVLRPVNRITQTARAIGTERDLSHRVQYRGPDDEIGRLATTFNAMLDELQVAYQQQQQFVADVSHELRTPLTTIRGNLELLRREPPISAEDRDDVLGDVITESERLIRLVNDLLTLARAESRRPLRSELVDVRPLIEDVCRQAEILDPARVITRVPSDASVVGDADALKQVLLILLDNALKHTAGPIAVATAVEDEHVAISIQDSGPGIDPAEMPHVFERFYRGSEARDKPGLGLGLPIARALAEAQGGTLTVQSRVGQGTVVTLTLPQMTVGQEPASAARR